MNQIYLKYVSDPYPARTTLQAPIAIARLGLIALR